MARELYEGVLAQLATGAAAPDTPFTLWDDQIGGTQVTDVVAADGISAYDRTTDGGGQLQPFRGPDGYKGLLFADTGTGIRYKLLPTTVWVQLLAVLGFGSASVVWDAILEKPTTFVPSSHTHTAGQISDATTIGQSLVRAIDAQSARAAIGAGTGNGTSNLTLGSTASTAAPGNHSHPATAVTFSPTGALTATNVQTAIEQAALTGSGSGGVGDSISWVYASGAYPALPTTKPAGVKVVTAYGPVQPTTLPSWLTTGDPILSYLYRAAS